MEVPVTMHRSEKYAVDKRHLAEMDRTFLLQNCGCSRKVYNLYVDCLYKRLDEIGYQTGDALPKIRFPQITEFKAEYPYLKEADSLGLCNAKIAFEKAVKRFNEQKDRTAYTKRALRRDASGVEKLSFRGLKGMPKFHAKARGDFSYTTDCQHAQPGNNLKRDTVRLEGDTLYLPKLKHGIKLIIHRKLPGNAVIGKVTISMDADGLFYASINYTHTIMMDMTFRDAAVTGDTSVLENMRILGLDYSQPDFYVDSDGRKANYPHYYRQSEEKLSKLQKRLSRMQQGSHNYERMRLRIARLHKKIANQRRDFIEQESCYLAKSYDVIAVEDIDLRSMGQALVLGKNLHDNGFGMFRNALQRKLLAKGSVLVKVDRFFPSTKTCSACGSINRGIRLGVSAWDCPDCGTHHLRDKNAAINIRDEGKRVFLEYFADFIQQEADARKRAEALSAARHRKSA